MADARAKAVLSEIVNNWSRNHYIFDLIRDIGPANSKGDIIDIPSQARPTNTSPTSRAAPQSLSPTVTALTVDQEAFYNVLIPKRDEDQLLNGSWPALTAESAIGGMRIDIDDNLLSYLSLTLAYDTSATYHDNVAAATLTDNMFANSEAKMLSQDGVNRQDLVYVMSAFGMGQARVVADWLPAGMAAEQSGRLGLPVVGLINGIPAVDSNSVIRNRTVATTAAVTTGSGVTHTYTVAAGHGLVPGMLVTVAGHDADENIATATAITSVTATTVVVTTAATADGTSSDASGTITSATSYNLLMDRQHIYGAMQRRLQVRVVEDFESSQDGLQVYSSFGRIGLAGRVRVLHSAGSSVS